MGGIGVELGGCDLSGDGGKFWVLKGMGKLGRKKVVCGYLKYC